MRTTDAAQPDHLALPKHECYILGPFGSCLCLKPLVYDDIARVLLSRKICMPEARPGLGIALFLPAMIPFFLNDC